MTKQKVENQRLKGWKSVGRLANELQSIMDRAQQREARESVGQFSYSSSVFKKPTPDWSR